MTSRSNLPDPCRTNPGWPASTPFETTGYGVPCPHHGCLGSTVSSRSARKGRPRTLLRNLQRHPVAGCSSELRQVGRDRVLAVRKKRQTPGPAPNLQRDPIGQCPCELRQVGGDGVPAVRRNIAHRGLCASHRVPWEGSPPRGPLECAYNRLLLASRCTGHPACCSGKRPRNALPDTNCRHRTSAMLCAVSFGRSPCPLCLCGSVLHASGPTGPAAGGRCARRWWCRRRS
jgi:hypothetical protein